MACAGLLAIAESLTDVAMLTVFDAPRAFSAPSDVLAQQV
jgi:hypothetical protein